MALEMYQRAIPSVDMRQVIGELVLARRGHFVFESGHHGDFWLDLELLCLRPGVMRPLAVELAKWVQGLRAEVVCGPLVEGAYVALMVAEEIGCDFVYTMGFDKREHTGLFPVEYRLPAALREKVAGMRVAIVNDVINAGSAVRETAADLVECGAKLVGIACLMTIGDAADKIALEHGVPLFRLVAETANLWTPEACPLCRDGVPMTN